MVHRELLAVLLVCCLGLSLVGVQPALAGDGSTTSLFGDGLDGLVQEGVTDGLIKQDSDEGSDTLEGTGTADGETGGDGTDSDDGGGESDDAGDSSPDDHDDNESDDEWGGHGDSESEDDDRWGDDSDDDRRWGEQDDDESGTESSDSDEGMWDSERRNESDTEPDDESSSDNDSDADDGEKWFDGSSDGEENGTDAGNETENSTTSANGTLDGFLLDDVTDIVVDVGDVTTNVTPDLSTNATNDTDLTRGEMSDWTTDQDADDDAEMRPSSGLDRLFDGDLDGTLETERFDELSAFVDGDGDRGVVAEIGGLVTTLESESVLVSKLLSVLAASPAEADDRQLSTDAEFEETAETEPDSGERTNTHNSSVPLAASDGGADDQEGSDEDDPAGADAGDDGGEAPSGGPGEGAALLVLVGYLGGGRLAMNQTAMLASMGQPGLVGTLQQSITSHLGVLSDRIVPPVFGYSRQDSSDPLENETRARIFELVEDSPGIYYAQLAEETDVTVETVRYHCRILADEGLVERRKLRGRQRLYPVSMEDDHPELAAAMADSAASDVLSAIERREPTTLSAVADAVGCAPSTVSYHLDRLEEDGLVSRERDGGSVRIRLRRATKSALQGSVADD